MEDFVPRPQLGLLTSALSKQLDSLDADWLNTALVKIAASDDLQTASELQLRYSAMARRKLGSAAISGLSEELHWHADQLGRILLISELLKLAKPVQVKDLINQVYKLADEYEKIAIIKGIDLLVESDLLVELALHTGRTNSISLFSAIALDNPYPALHYDDRAFNQLVLKALFMGLDIVDMIGLKSRSNLKLSELCADLVKERLLAGRQPPTSIWLAINYSHLSTKAKLCYLEFTIDEDPNQRYYSLLGLLENGASDCTDEFWFKLEQWLAVESEGSVRQIIIALLKQRTTTQHANSKPKLVTGSFE